MNAKVVAIEVNDTELLNRLGALLGVDLAQAVNSAVQAQETATEPVEVSEEDFIDTEDCFDDEGCGDECCVFCNPDEEDVEVEVNDNFGVVTGESHGAAEDRYTIDLGNVDDDTIRVFAKGDKLHVQATSFDGQECNVEFAFQPGESVDTIGVRFNPESQELVITSFKDGDEEIDLPIESY